VWTVQDRCIGLFLECDLRTESPSRLIAKLPAYARLAAVNGPLYPVLFWLSSPEREAHLHTALNQARLDVPTATATHDTDPAGPVWLPGNGHQRMPLDQLPSFHGRPSAANPNFRDGHLHLHDEPPYPWT
jgi:hypothetical protein